MADAVVQLLSAARDVAARSPYQRAIVPKLIELADEIMRFGDTALQDEFIAMAQAADFFLFSLRAQLKAFMAEVKRALERSVSKDASHLTKRLEAQTVTFTQCRTLLHFIQMLCEGHNGRAQDYLRNQDELGLGRKAKKINLVSEVAHFFREVTESMPERLSFVPSQAAVEECLAHDEHVKRLLGHSASQHLQQVRLVLWSDYTETEVQAVAMQLRLLEQTLDTLAEFVQGPCAENQLVLARSCVCENAMPLLDFLLALQLSGGHGAGGHEPHAARRVVPYGYRGRAAAAPQPW